MADLDDNSKLKAMRGQRVGRILRKMGKLNRERLQEALDLQKTRRIPVGQLLIELGYCADEDVNRALAIQAGMDMFDLTDYEIKEAVIKTIPAETAMAYQILPILFDKETNTITIALKDASNFRAIDDLRMLMGFNVKPVVAKKELVEKLLQTHYGEGSGSMGDLINEIANDDKLNELQDRGQSIDLDALIDAAEDSKVKRLLNLVLMQSIKDHASDIHLEPFEDEFRMRYRVDGQMLTMVPPPKHLALPIVSRIKVMANLDIAEHRIPQDGRIELTVGNEPVDLRVSVLPTMSGESVVMRILDRSNVSLDLSAVGMRPDDLANFRQLISKPNGIVIVTGPTGSGKTTTLYAALNELNTPDVKILTTEEPVEYPMEGMCQVPINPEVDMTFAAALRSFLRQDPDIILVGETRDKETAGIAVEAALTGHLVFTTLHTNDAAGSIARLLDLGIESFMITATMVGAQAQRLVKRICDNCRYEYEITEQEIMELNLDEETTRGRKVFRGGGCDFCNGTGYRKRTGIFEIFLLDDELKQMIIDGASTQMLNDRARDKGMSTLRDAGLQTVWEGTTTTEELLNVTLSS